MAEPKTRPTTASVAKFIAAVPDLTRRADCRALATLMRRVTGARPKMWGPGIVGFGSCQLRYADGSELDWPLAAFSPRKQALTVYLTADFREHGLLLKRLGPHKASSSCCLYLKRLDDVDLDVLEKLVTLSVARSRSLKGQPARPRKRTRSAG